MIRGFIDETPGSPAPRVWATIELIGILGVKQPSDPIGFLIDTGASHTVLHPTDAVRRLGLRKARLQDRRNWRTIESSAGVGGQASSFVVPCRHSFLHETGEVLSLEAEIRVAEVTAYNEAHPSLLGRDLLNRFVLTIAVNRDEVLLDYLVRTRTA